MSFVTFFLVMGGAGTIWGAYDLLFPSEFEKRAEAESMRWYQQLYTARFFCGSLVMLIFGTIAALKTNPTYLQLASIFFFLGLIFGLLGLVFPRRVSGKAFFAICCGLWFMSLLFLIGYHDTGA